MKLEKKENDEEINIFQKYYLPKIGEEMNKKLDYLDYTSFLSSSNKKQQKQNDNLFTQPISNHNTDFLSIPYFPKYPYLYY
jgi:hypothetical protein